MSKKGVSGIIVAVLLVLVAIVVVVYNVVTSTVRKESSNMNTDAITIG